MKCIVGGNAQKAKVMGNTWLLITDKSVWLSEPTTYSLCQQWRALWSLPLMLHGNRLILSEFVPCLSLVYILFAPSCHQFVPLRNFACWWGFLICFRFFSCCPLPCSVFTPFCCFCCCCWCCCCCCDWSLLPHHQAPFPHLLPTTLQITNWWSCCWRDWDLTKIEIFEDEWDWLIGWFWWWSESIMPLIIRILSHHCIVFLISLSSLAF